MFTVLKKYTSGPFGWLMLFVFVFLLVYVVFLWTEQSGIDHVSDVGDGIEVVEENGKTVIRNEDVGYEFEVSEDYYVTLREVKKITLIEKDRPSDEPYSGLGLSIEEIYKSTIEEYLDGQTEEVGLNDPGVLQKKEGSLDIMDVSVQVMSFDFANSYWPSEGGLTVLYLFPLDKKKTYGLVSQWSASKEVVKETKQEVYEIISTIIESTKD